MEKTKKPPRARKAKLVGKLELSFDGKVVSVIDFTTSRESDSDFLRLVFDQYIRHFRERRVV